MASRKTKQITYGTVYILIWAGIIAGLYFWLLKPSPSCFDGIQDQGELGVDCGGPCAQICIPTNIQSITSVGSVSLFASTPGSYTLLAQVENPNANQAAQSFDYNFDLYNGSGTLVQAVPAETFLYSGQIRYLILVNQPALQSVDHAGITISNIDWVASTTLGAVPKFALENLGQGPSGSSTISVNGQVTDNDPSAFENILVVGIFKNASGAVVGASQTEIDSISSGQTETFSVAYPAGSGTAIDPSLTQFFAYATRQ